MPRPCASITPAPGWGKAVHTAGVASRKLLWRGDFAHYAAGQFAAMLVEVWGQYERKRVSGGVEGIMAAYCMPWLCYISASAKRKALGFLATLLLLFNAAVPYWHAAQKVQAWASAYADPEARHEAQTYAELECHHLDGAAPEQRGSDQPPSKTQTCPLCKALAALFAGRRSTGCRVPPSHCARRSQPPHPAPSGADGSRLCGRAGPAARAPASLSNRSTKSAASAGGVAI